MRPPGGRGAVGFDRTDSTESINSIAKTDTGICNEILNIYRENSGIMCALESPFDGGVHSRGGKKGGLE